jgi:penicillin-binding protein 1C
VRLELRARARGYPWRTVAVAAAVCAVVLAAWVRLGPIPADLLHEPETPSTIVEDRHGVRLYEARAADGTRSRRLEAASLPRRLADATIAAEDHRFASHAGIDPVAMLRALKANLVEGRVVEGGSTITQQVAKLLLTRREPGRHRGLVAKVEEAILAVRLEHRFSKREILAMYLNMAAYGNQIVGAGRASEVYFGHDASLLTPAQAAFLAGLPQRPSGFNPYRNLASATSRQRTVLRRMERAGMLTSDEARAAGAERLSLAQPDSPFLAPHFVEMVLAATGPARPERLPTTLDAALQADIAGIVRSQRPGLQKHGAHNIAVVVLDNARSEWLAWEGSGNYADAAHGGAIDGTRAPRQPGSALKPFTYALAFEEGFTPATVLPDVPSHFPTAEPGVVYSPRNYDGRFRGPLLARRALAGSQNVPAVALASQLGVPSLLRFLGRAGFTTFDRNAAHYGLGVTLGNAEVRLDELVAAYAAFARGGEWIEPTWAAGGGATGRARRTLVSPRTAFWIADVLSDSEAREYVFGRGGSLDFPFHVAVKTGTSQAYHDNWVVGFTREVTVGVWVGNFDRTRLRNSSGVTGAGPLFHAVMLAAQQRVTGRDATARVQPIVEQPADLRERRVCGLSGLAANAWCPSHALEWLPVDADVLPCSWHRPADEGLVVAWPSEYREWALRQGLHVERARADPAARTARVAGRIDTAPLPPLEITSPAAGATYLLDPTLRREFQTLPLRAVAARPGRIEWIINGRVIGTRSSDESLDWPLVPGAHTVLARARGGDTATTTFVVR